jgi:hypothetical protein
MVDRFRWLHPRQRGAQRRSQDADRGRGYSGQGCSSEVMVSLGLEGKAAAQTDSRVCSSVAQTTRRKWHLGRESMAATPAVNNAATEASRARQADELADRACVEYNKQRGFYLVLDVNVLWQTSVCVYSARYSPKSNKGAQLVGADGGG